MPPAVITNVVVFVVKVRPPKGPASAHAEPAAPSPFASAPIAAASPEEWGSLDGGASPPPVPASDVLHAPIASAVSTAAREGRSETRLVQRKRRPTMQFVL